MIKKLHTCFICNKSFMNAMYWYDSIHDAKYDRRLIRPFCGPVCAHKYRDDWKTNEWPARPTPWPKGPEWQIIQDIDHIDYESD